MPYQKRCGCKIHHTPKRWGKIYIYTRKHLTTRSHSSFFPLLCHLSSSQKDKLFHTTIRANKALFPEDPHRMSSVLPGQHPALLPQLLYDSSSPSLRFLPSRPLALTSGRARGSLRVAASKLCICWLTRQTDKGEAHPVDIPPGRMWMGVSLPCSATILIKKKKEKKSRNLVSLRAFICLSFWNEISQRDKCSVSITYGQRGGCSRNQAEIEKNWEALFGKPLPVHKFSRSPNDWLE